jgi:DNA-binding CsgD family transcriptional regulator
VLSARGSELEREFPYGIARQLFEPLLGDPEVRERAFDGAAAAARPVFETPGADVEGAAGDVGFATLHGLYWLVLNIAGDDPLMLAIDDLHWVDRPSLRFVAYLVRRLEGVSILVAATTRRNEPGADAAMLAELAHDPLTTSVEPGPLSEAGIAAVIEQRLERKGEPRFVGACGTATGGNPLLLHELMKALRADGVAPLDSSAGALDRLGPRAVSRSVLLRLARLSPEARATAEAAAVLDDGFDVASLAGLAELDESTAARATGELTQAEILRPERPLGFVHPLVRAAIYGDVSPGLRELKHARAAALLTESGAPAENVASHLLAVPPRGDAGAVKTLRMAARRAMQKGATESAVAYFRRAVAEPPPAGEATQTLLELGLVESLTSAPDAVEHLRGALDALTDPLARGLTANVLARTMLWSAPREAADLARVVAAEMPPELESVALSLQAFEAATTAFGVERPDAIERLEAWRDPARATDLGGKAMAAVASWSWALANGPLEEVVALARRSLEGGELIAADNGLLPMYAIGALLIADREQSDDPWAPMIAEAHRRGSMFGITTIYLWHGYALLRRGDLLEAEASLRAAIESFEAYGYGSSGNVYVLAALARILLERGDVAGARALVDQIGDPGPTDAARYWFQAKMGVLLADGNAGEALELADEVPGRVPWAVNPTEFYPRSWKAQALARLGRDEEAIALASEELALARQWGAPATVGYVLRVLGEIDAESRLDHLGEAVEVLEGSSTRLEYAKALCSLGTALRLDRQPSEAREPLQRALELASICDATALVERARAELHASGARPRREALTGAGSLTPSERRVADLAAGGKTNREIAQELYVTPKTVEVHLSSSYRKLEIRSRRELAGALATV